MIIVRISAITFEASTPLQMCFALAPLCLLTKIVSIGTLLICKAKTSLGTCAMWKPS